MIESIAHIRDADKKIQTVEEHLIEVKILAEQYGEKLSVSHMAGLAGMLHDLGKYSSDFILYIKQAVFQPDVPPRRGSVDHSTAGGKFLYQLFHEVPTSPMRMALVEIVGNAIISHHSYLHDFVGPDRNSAYLHRVRDKSISELDWMIQCFYSKVMDEEQFENYVSEAEKELKHYINKESSLNTETKLMFLSKFIFSALIDADRTNTRLFEQGSPDFPRPNEKVLFKRFYERLMERIASLEASTKGVLSPINKLRKEMSEQCDQFALRTSGIYTLSIPTGGGKTLASFRYALKHAINHKKKRIIYILPFTTVIEQNAEEIRQIIGEGAYLLEHHSNIFEQDFEEHGDENAEVKHNLEQKLKLAKDNWDSPIIFTTMVQFLNVFYEKGSRNIRRMHRLCESVLIFDEVQKVPIHCLALFNESLNFLNQYGNSSILLCTATQPALDFVNHRLHISADGEIIKDIKEVQQAFKRVEIVDRATGEEFNTEKLAQFIEEILIETQSILVILNTKAAVKKLYSLLKNQGGLTKIYHLSTAMCPVHRQEILKEVRERLENNNPLICISTPLIEAGVDVSFECVIRSLAGLDSIAQAAGRCNRHGEHPLKQVYIINHVEENLDKLQEIKSSKQITQSMLIDMKKDDSLHGGSLLSDSAIKLYFQHLYNNFSVKAKYPISNLGLNMVELLTISKKENPYVHSFRDLHGENVPLVITNSYRTAADHFKVIDQLTTAVIVPYGKGKKIIADLNGQQTISDLTSLLKEAPQYTIQLYIHELEQLKKENGLMLYLEGNAIVLTEGYYNKEFGFSLDDDRNLTLMMI